MAFKPVGVDENGDFPARVKVKIDKDINDKSLSTGLVNAQGRLILKKGNGTEIDAGYVLGGPKGDKGDTGPAGGVNSVNGLTGAVALDVPYMGQKDLRNTMAIRGAVNTGVNGGVDIWNPEINGLQKNAYYRQKFAAGMTNKWYINNQVLLGTRAEMRGKSILVRYEQKDTTATSLGKTSEPITIAVNKAGDWGPGSYWTEIPVNDAKVKTISANLYLIKLDDWIDAAMVDTDTVYINFRIFNRSLPNANSSYMFSSDFWFRVAIVDENELNFTTVAAQSTILQGFTDDTRRFAKTLTTGIVNLGGSGGSTLNPTSAPSGLATRYTRPQTTQPDTNWNYQIASSGLGTLLSLKGKRFLFRFDDSLSEMKPSATNGIGIGKSQSQWAQVKFSMDPTTYWTIKKGDDLYTLGKAAGLVDTDNIYFLGGAETRTATTPAINWEIGAAWLEDASSVKSILVADMVAGFDPTKYVTKEYADAKQPAYITCWGDSLTAGGGWTDVLQADLGIPLYNAGTGGENADTIFARQGADVMMINDITIPAGTTPVQIGTYASGITTQFGKKAMPLLQGGTAHVNPVKIGDIEGTLAFTGTAYNDTTGNFTFTRTVAGTQTAITRPTAIRTKADRDWNDGLMIAYIGQNGGYVDDADLVRRHRLMRQHYKGRFKMVVLGLSSGSASSRAAYEAAMTQEFGRYFISLRDYLSKYGIADAGLTPTQADTDAMATGTVPPQLLADTVHYTATTKTVIGKMLVKKLRELQVVTT